MYTCNNRTSTPIGFISISLSEIERFTIINAWLFRWAKSSLMPDNTLLVVFSLNLECRNAIQILVCCFEVVFSFDTMDVSVAAPSKPLRHGMAWHGREVRTYREGLIAGEEFWIFSGHLTGGLTWVRIRLGFGGDQSVWAVSVHWFGCSFATFGRLQEKILKEIQGEGTGRIILSGCIYWKFEARSGGYHVENRIVTSACRASDYFAAMPGKWRVQLDAVFVQKVGRSRFPDCWEVFWGIYFPAFQGSESVFVWTECCNTSRSLLILSH